MRGHGTAARRRKARRGTSKVRLFGLMLAAAITPFSTTSIARQDATSLLPGAADLADAAGGRYLAAVPRRPVDLVSLETADLFGAGRGPMAPTALFDGGDALMVLDLPEAEPESRPKGEGPAPFVDRTLKTDRALIAPIRPAEPAVRRAEVDGPGPFDALPSLSQAFALDLTGLTMLPHVDTALLARRAPLVVATSPKAAPVGSTPSAGKLRDETPDEPLSADAGLTAVPMTPREAGARHDGTTPSVAAMNGGRTPTTTTPASDAPLAVAALPVTRMLAEPAARASRVALTPSAKSAAPEGETVAIRGDMDGDGTIETRLSHRVLMPEAQLAKAEQCLAEAIYFEARGESKEGQYAVAQVVMNRTRSGYYPADVCGVVYQNAHRRNACQFSFACDRIPDRVTNKFAWNIATAIARDVTRNGAWLPEVGDSTHYHATYVRPNWIRDMIKEDRIGSHIFYRVRWRAPIGA
ncbi:cell wall hydrolase [Chenggangzhangella methanolivorans]|uniref:cell wall hydrolase n=1 Tax=Chenggangzhangella methanolivorans TaxID=1437009 RepID=UPI003606B07A